MDRKIKKIMIILCFGALISCSSVGKRIVPNSAVVSRDVVMNNSIAEVKRKFNEEIGTQHVGLYKKGFRNWKVILYGEQAYYQVIVTEDGKIFSSERLEYK
ncbi:hypothetical protein [Leptotrichia trevisanii]|uniref:Lipoprotein n=1 Tax=Leptotrichia trevisanii TaxID=109328 RepID=A0A510JXZ0_9FUSO|nr:hypothetical protein [Leptotrichia trevisanii]BBM44260.1 hypothetical protein JMUB3870_0367 [Leptotrichia trevisanii]